MVSKSKITIAIIVTLVAVVMIISTTHWEDSNYKAYSRASSSEQTPEDGTPTMVEI